MATCGDVPENPYAGPVEKRLRALVSSGAAGLVEAETSWKNQADALKSIEVTLTQQATAIAGMGEMGRVAAEAFKNLAQSITARENEMRNVALGLGDAITTTTMNAKNKLGALPPVDSPPEGDLMSNMIAARWKAHDGQIAAREKAAQDALDALDVQYTDAAAQMGHVKTDDTTYGQGGQQGATRTGSSLSSAPPSRAVSTSHVLTSPQGQTDSTPHLVPTTTITTPDTEIVPSGNEDASPSGNISSGGNPTPARSTPFGGSPGGSGTSGVGGASAAIGAAGALTAVGSTAIAARGGVGASAANRPGAAGIIGRSATGASSGNLGRGGMLPGQQGAPGQSGRGAGGGRTSAGARGLLPGQAGQQTQGKAGGRRGPLSSAATGGRGGKRDDEREKREGFTYGDQAGWLEDDTTADSVLD